MRQLGLILRSRTIFILLYCVFLWSLATGLISTLSMRISISNLAGNIAPPLIIGMAGFVYWFYMTKTGGSGFGGTFERPRLSLKLFISLIFVSLAGAALAALAGSRFTTAAGMMGAVLYAIGLISVVVVSVFRPHLGVCAFILALPFALMLHLDLRFQGGSDEFGHGEGASQ
ncbi:hypothetical protein ACFLX9_00430 [Chloroflexota bacterium]